MVALGRTLPSVRFYAEAASVRYPKSLILVFQIFLLELYLPCPRDTLTKLAGDVSSYD